MDAHVLVQARDRVLQHVAGAAVQLHAFVDHLAAGLGDPPLGHRGAGVVQRARGQQADAAVQPGTRQAGLGFALGQLEARVLQRQQVLAEHLAAGRELQRLLDRALHAGQRHGGRDHALAAKLLHELAKALALARPEQVGAGHAHVVEEQLGRVLRVQADLGQRAAAAKALRHLVRLHDQDGDALGALARVGLDHQADQVGRAAVGDVGLGTVDHVVVAVAARRGADALQVRARAGLGHGQSAHELARGHARQPVALLRLAREVVDVVGHDAAVQRIAEPGAQHAALLGEQHDLVQEVAAAAAVGLGDAGAQQAGRAGLVPDLAVHDLLLRPALLVRQQLGLVEAPRAVAQGLQLGGHPGGWGHVVPRRRKREWPAQAQACAGETGDKGDPGDTAARACSCRPRQSILPVPARGSRCMNCTSRGHL